MNRITQVFQRNKEKNEGVFIPFITAGDPDFDSTIKIGNLLFDCGADILELGIPFSDPIADGPTIQASSQRALEGGITPVKAMKIAQALKDRGPIVFMAYYNIPLQYGLSRFIIDANENGVDGIIIPDLPIEESNKILAECEKHDVALIFLIAPTTNQKRLKQIIDSSCAYVYLVSTLGVTGEKNTIAEITKTMISRVKSLAKGKIPIAVGFGISQPKHVKEILRYGADGVIVGSAIINRINNGSYLDIRQFVLDLKESTKNLSSSKNLFLE